MIEIIPAIDLIGGQCVRLVEGDFSRKTIYSDDPVKVALEFRRAGVRRLHMVDLDGAKSGKPANMDVLRRVAEATDLVIDFSGGVKTNSDVEAVFEAGASIVAVGSTAVRNEAEFWQWLDEYGPERFILAADARDRKIAVDGWQTSTTIPVEDFIYRHLERGVISAMVTDIAVDGGMSGPSIELYKHLRALFPDLALIASGGVRSMEDVRELESTDCAAVIVGKAIYEGNITLDDIRDHVS